MMGVILFNAGSFFRYLDARSRGAKGKSFLAAPGPGVTLGVFWSTLYQYFAHVYRKGKYRNQALVNVTILFVISRLVDELFGFDPVVDAHKPILVLLKALRQVYRLGPQKEVAVE